MNKKNSVVVLTALLLTACGGSSSKSAPDLGAAQGEFELNGDITMLGFVQSNPRRYEDQNGGGYVSRTDLSAQFFQYQFPVPHDSIQLLAQIYGGVRTPGCLYLENARFGTPHPEQTNASDEYDAVVDQIAELAVDAGNELTITPPIGEQFALKQNFEIAGQTYIYEGGQNYPEWLQENAVIDLPGGVFPSFNGVAMNVMPPIDDLESSLPNGEITAGSTMTWSAPANPNNSTVTIVAHGDGVLFCTVPDIGSFTWPEELNQMSFVDDIAAERSSINVVQSGNALVIVYSNTTYN